MLRSLIVRLFMPCGSRVRSRRNGGQRRVWARSGNFKGEEARQMLSEIYHWFTEGFDTKDLQEAKALLQELA
jgi:predicted ATPase